MKFCLGTMDPKTSPPDYYGLHWNCLIPRDPPEKCKSLKKAIFKSMFPIIRCLFKPFPLYLGIPGMRSAPAEITPLAPVYSSKHKTGRSVQQGNQWLELEAAAPKEVNTCCFPREGVKSLPIFKASFPESQVLGQHKWDSIFSATLPRY